MCLYFRRSGEWLQVTVLNRYLYQLKYKTICPHATMQYLFQRIFESFLSKGCIKEIPTSPLVVNPLTVAINRSGKEILVFDCRHLNLDFCTD